jgi:hypothetical protein
VAGLVRVRGAHEHAGVDNDSHRSSASGAFSELLVGKLSTGLSQVERLAEP